MRLQKRVIYSVVFALILFFVSMFTKITPCQTAPVVPNPIYQWSLCNLSPDSVNILGVNRLYFGYTSSLTETYVIFLVLAFIAAMIILHLIAKPRREK